MNELHKSLMAHAEEGGGSRISMAQISYLQSMEMVTALIFRSDVIRRAIISAEDYGTLIDIAERARQRFNQVLSVNDPMATRLLGAMGWAEDIQPGESP